MDGLQTQNYLSGGSPRYNIYKTKDEGFIAAAPLRIVFGKSSVKPLIYLEKYVSQLNEDLESDKKENKKIIYKKIKKKWQVIFDKADCCCCVVKSTGGNKR